MKTIVWIQSISYDGLIEHHQLYENSWVNSLLSHIFTFKLYETIAGRDTKVLLVLDNAPWHNRLTEDTMPPKRS
jgi:hypothetical protein